MFDPLPIDEVLPELLEKLRNGTAVILHAPTGAGKTTRVPPALLNAMTPTQGQILMLEPRRLAARAAARRMAQERDQPLGSEIGYHVRFDRQAGPHTRILVMTPGILLRRLQDDPFLESAGIVVFDEFHERSLDCDLALGMLRLLQTTVRPELRIVAMSATLESEALAAYLGDCPVVTSTGRSFSVTMVYEPRSLQQPWPIAAARAIERRLTQTDGDVLCFLPGMQEIRQTARELEPVMRSRDLLVLTLHGDLTPQEQDQALLPQERRRIVLATNVAESSVTVEGITTVVDTGLARRLTFDASVGMDRLELAPIARDAAEQRAGRAGRTCPGICVRLWSEASHRQREQQTLPEICRVDLAGAILQLLVLGETDLRNFPWLDRPREESLAQALALLERLQALREGTITPLGRSMARLPVHPRLGRLLIEGQRLGQPERGALAAALLSERDPFLRTQESAKSPWRDKNRSEILGRIEALETYEARGSTTFAVGTLHEGGTRFLLRARDQLLRSLRQELPVSLPPTAHFPEPDEAVLRALLVAFPDRVARRREVDPTLGIMVGRRGVRLAPWCADTGTELFLCIDVQAEPGESLVRQASALQREWLADKVVARTEVFFDEREERVRARRRVYYEDLLLEESDAALPTAEKVECILVEAARLQLPRVMPTADSDAGSFLKRLHWLRYWMPELDLPAFKDGELLVLLPWACAGCRSFDEVRRADWLGLLHGKLTAAQWQAVEREAPQRLQVPSGSRLSVHYEGERAPILAVRIQEIFGWHETPRLAGGRERVQLHLLAPNDRPQQITDDLASFWKNTYPRIRKELRARYPRHAWPEDPLHALAERRPRRKET